MVDITTKCRVKLKDVEAKLMSPRRSLHLWILPIPFSPETGFEAECEIIKREEKNGKIIEEKLGTIHLEYDIKDQQLYITSEMKNYEKLVKELGIQPLLGSPGSVIRLLFGR